MLRLAVQMARHRISALLAVVCAVLGGAALITGTGVLAESGLRSQLPPGRFGGADILVSADQTFRDGPDLPIALPERGTVPALLVARLAQLPGVTAAAGDISFPVGLLDAGGRAVPVGDPRTAGHNWSSFELLSDGAEMDGRKPSGSGEIAVDSAVAAAAGVRPGDEVRVLAAGRAAAPYRVSAVIAAPGAGILFPDRTATHLTTRDTGPRAETFDLIALRTKPGTTARVAAAVRAELRAGLAGRETDAAAGAAHAGPRAREVRAAAVGGEAAASPGAGDGGAAGGERRDAGVRAVGVVSAGVRDGAAAGGGSRDIGAAHAGPRAREVRAAAVGGEAAASPGARDGGAAAGGESRDAGVRAAGVVSAGVRDGAAAGGGSRDIGAAHAGPRAREVRAAAVGAEAGAPVGGRDTSVRAVGVVSAGVRDGAAAGGGSRDTGPAHAGPRAREVRAAAVSGEAAASPGARDAAAAHAGTPATRPSHSKQAQPAASPNLLVSSGEARGDVGAPDAVAARGVLVLLASSLAGIILLITGFVMAGALGVAVAGQRRELALMRAVGATPKQIRRLAASQATVIAAVALVPGIPLGHLLAGQFRRLLVDRGVVPEALPLTYSPLPALATLLLLALAVQVSARGAAWRTSRMPATEAVAESRSEPRRPSRLRTRAGLLLVVAATTLSVVPLLSRTALGASATSIAGILAAIGLAMAGPALVRSVSDTLARRLPAGASPATWLAMSNVRGYAIRIAGVVSTLAMAVVFTLTYVLAQTTVLTATTDDVRSGTLAQQRLSAPGLGGLPDGTLAAVRETPGVRAAAPVTSTTVLWPYEQLGDPVVESAAAMILDPAAPGVLDLGVRSGSLARLTGDTVAVGSDVATSRDAGVGRRIALILGDGTRVTPRVVAVYDRDLGFGPVVVSRDLAIDHTTTRLDQSILIRTDTTGTARGTAHDSLAALAAGRPGLSLEPADTTGAGLSDAPPEVWVNLATVVVLLGYLLLSIANKLTATTAQRHTEIATLRLNGTTPRQIRAMMRREAALIAAAALTAGLAVSAVPLGLLGVGFLDRPWPAGPPWLLPAVALTIVSIAFLTIELPTRRALRTSPAEALAHRE